MSHNSDMVRAALSVARSQVLDETGIYIEGDKKIIPERYRDDPARYVTELAVAIESLGRKTAVARVLFYRPWDVGVVLERWFREEFGMSLASMAQASSATMPVVVNAQGDTVTIPLGTFDADFLYGSLSISGVEVDGYGEVTEVRVITRLRHKQPAEAFLDLLTERMATESIYKGQAMTYGYVPEFYDTSKVDSSRVIYTADVAADLEAHIWSRIRYRNQMAARGIPFKRHVMLHGLWGTGKTLAAGVTAQISVENGVTFIKGNPGDTPADLMALAYTYQPSVVFMEDADTFLSSSNPDAVSYMLDVFDGLGAKDRDVMVVMTTNHIERIHKGMLRPGRLDAIIEIGALDDDARERFIRSHIDDHLIDPALDMEPINESMDGYVAAYVKEALDRSLTYAMSRNYGMEPDRITTQDIVQAAKSVRSQHELHVNAQEGVPTDRLSDALRAALVPNIVEPITAHTQAIVSTRPDTGDLHAIVSHNLRAYLQGLVIRDLDGDATFTLDPSSPFYRDW